ncbi:MAG: nucleoside monophosphate kinase, partial [Minisyncoccales bacterium]
MSQKNNLSVILILGPPGSGKGTQASLLAKELDYYHLETSKILEREINKAKEGETIEIEGEDYSYAKEKKLWKEGKLMSPPFVAHLLKEEIKKLYKQKFSLIFSGSPRTLFEAKRIYPLLSDLFGEEDLDVIQLKLSAKESIFRNSHRRICKLMRHSILYNDETKNLTKCPLDGSELLERKGLDDPETIKVRVKEFK